jgi:hypothetical protein
MAAMVKVWVCLQTGDEEVEGGVLVNTGGDIDDLRDAVKLKMANKLAHCDAVDLQVLQPNGEPFRLSAYIPSTTEDNPLIIKAPKEAQEGKIII